MAERGAEAEELEDPLNGDPEPGDELEPQDDPDPNADPEPDPDAEPDPEGAEPAEPEPRRGKQSAQDRVQQALRDRDAERTARVAAEQRAAAAEAAQRERDARTEAADERALLDSLDEQGRVQYLLAKEVKATKDGQNAILRRMDDQADRADFATRAARDPRMAKLLDEVEAAHARCAPGTKREAVYFILLGKKIHEGATDLGAAQRQQAKRRVEAQRPAGRGAARSDAAPRGARAGSHVARMERDDPAI